jgi:hypothetical protein
VGGLKPLREIGSYFSPMNANIRDDEGEEMIGDERHIGQAVPQVLAAPLLEIEVPNLEEQPEFTAEEIARAMHHTSSMFGSSMCTYYDQEYPYFSCIFSFRCDLS